MSTCVPSASSGQMEMSDPHLPSRCLQLCKRCDATSGWRPGPMALPVERSPWGSSFCAQSSAQALELPVGGSKYLACLYRAAIVYVDFGESLLWLGKGSWCATGVNLNLSGVCQGHLSCPLCSAGSCAHIWKVAHVTVWRQHKKDTVLPKKSC